MPRQWLRKCTLVVSQSQFGGGGAGDQGPAAAGTGAEGLDLSQLHIQFRVCQSDVETPNNALIRVYNLSDDTAKRINKEFIRVTLQAGYESGDVGVIHQGTIKMVRRGRDNPTDTFVEILSADGDLEYNFGQIQKTLAAGWKVKDQIDAAAFSMGLPVGYTPDLPQAAASRPKTMYGMSRIYMREAAETSGCTWSIVNGKVQFLPLTSYLPGEAVVLNSATGMIGLPTQTEAGISVRCLLNPKLKIGGLVQIDNKSIQRAFLGGSYLYTPGRLENLPGLLPKVTDDGFYRIYVVEFVGDNRGPPSSPWFAELTCLAVDKTAQPDRSVQAYG